MLFIYLLDSVSKESLHHMTPAMVHVCLILSVLQGFSELDIYCIDLVEDLCHGQYEESKVSSSSLRKRLLGTLIHPVKVFNALLPEIIPFYTRKINYTPRNELRRV